MSWGQTSRRVRAVISAAALLAGATTSLLAAQSAQAAPQSKAADCSTAYLGPQDAGRATGNFFDLHVTAGQHLTEHLIAANPTKSRCLVDLRRAFGKTAINSGDTYVGVGETCTGVACWLSKLPKTVSLPPNSRVTVPFDVVAPQDAAPGQYLAGVVGQPNVTSVASAARSGVQVQVRTRVAIGVAITVAGALRPSLHIPTVTVDSSRAPYASTVAITERNSGNTWEHPAGTMTVQVGSRATKIRVVSNTILGGNGTAILRAGAGRITGTHHARVVLWYAQHTKRAVWEGTLTFPALAAAHTKGNQIVLAPASKSVPLWAWIAIGAVVLLLLLVLALLLLLWKRRGHKDDDETNSTPTKVAPTIEPATG